MLRFIRTGTVKTAALTPKAMGYAMELTGWLNKKYDVNIQVGGELFGSLKVHWHMEMPDLATIEEFNKKIMQDSEYWAFLDKGNDFWVEGSLKDTVVSIMD